MLQVVPLGLVKAQWDCLQAGVILPITLELNVWFEEFITVQLKVAERQLAPNYAIGDGDIRSAMQTSEPMQINWTHLVAFKPSGFVTHMTPKTYSTRELLLNYGAKNLNYLGTNGSGRGT